MNAIPLINNAPRPNINVGSIGSPAFNPVAAGAKLGGSIGGNVMRQNPASMPVNNEAQLRQEINMSLVALKKEAFSLETLIAQAVQTLTDINSRIEALEGKQGDYVKKADATVESVGGDGKYISAISETDGKINATATDLGNMVPVNSVTSGNMHSVTSGAVYSALQNKVLNEWHILCRYGQKTYIHRDVNTSGDNPKWIKLIIYFHSSYNTATAVTEYLVRLNYTPYRNTNYRGLTPVLISGVEAGTVGYDVLANQSSSLGWDADGIYIDNHSAFADFSTTIISLYDRTA